MLLLAGGLLIGFERTFAVFPRSQGEYAMVIFFFQMLQLVVMHVLKIHILLRGPCLGREHHKELSRSY